MIKLGKVTGGQVTPLVLKDRVANFLAHHGADNLSGGRTEDERVAREEMSDRILGKYGRCEETGEYDKLSPEDEASVRGLLGGINAIQAEPTMVDAFDLYLKEKALPENGGAKVGHGSGGMILLRAA